MKAWMKWTLCGALACSVVLMGCDEAEETDAGVDSGVEPVDAGGGGEDAGGGGEDAGGGGEDAGTDGGPAVDPCASDDLAGSIGCNGILDPTPAENETGGTCTPGGDPVMPPAPFGQGSCTNSGDICLNTNLIDPGLADVGICSRFCDPGDAETAVVTADCFVGSRCRIGANFCQLDCEEDADCATGVCDETRGWCSGRDEPEVDAGVADGGMPDGGMPDGGVAADGG